MRCAQILGACLMLASCAAAVEIPQAIDVNDAERFEADKTACWAVAQKYEPQVSIASVGFGAASGAGNMISYAPLNWLMPVLGAIQGAAQSVTAGLDLAGQQRANVYKHCLRDKIANDRAAIVANPDN